VKGGSYDPAAGNLTPA